ncbi:MULTISPECIES: RagB/SusD family nutrient uptake outer membrane protein [Butyricimonas]|uniref:RagB/SusD family nutrient uptake outer membrane protein n=1 Tax=Butyricimonas TaxID=574697 RepID=UPI001D0644EF|nr:MULTISPECIES: RagB/SusD family nutrient uptake outer membrane protein [Butyricimonas]MCB6973577.1 RagB/SusD family nutrient uptake outer membrane protein [Butyricimonas synergistica]MCG4520320.1 RagB/SusD family nutrient uptake outer membrane protein [Butyricimonas sp. DFI.6.44]
MRNILVVAICTVSLFLSSCQDWIDVNPKTDIEAEKFFTSEDGFKSALTGLYSMMTLEKSYGRQMTFDFVEKLVQRYDNYAPGAVTDEERAAIYKYGETTSSKNAIADIWLKLYNEIANINNFLQYLETNGDVILTEGYRDLMKGEALGLRAFHYFDILRLWGPIYSLDSTKLCVPYRDKFDSESAPMMAANEVVKRIVADLQAAEELLKNDPMNYEHVAEEPFVGQRKHRMNKFAVKAMLARVYLYRGNKELAAQYAREVIEKSGLELVRNNQQDVSLYGETVFGLAMYDMEEKLKNYWVNGSSYDVQYYITGNNASGLFEINEGIGLNDMRYRSGYGFNHTASNLLMCRKYLGEGLYGEKIPLIRLAEMYYILAESVALSECGQYINTVRTTRGISRSNNLGTDVTEEQRLEVLDKEYRKEFFAEGQYFYFLKRHNRSTFYRCPVENFSAYVLPVPDDEKTYGEAE